MAQHIRFHETGGPEVLRYGHCDVGQPGPGEVRIRHAAIGLNFADIYSRSGIYPHPLPSGLGREAAGVVEAVGADVVDFMVGDRVTYTSSPLGAYCSERVMDARYLFKLPEEISFETAAAMTMRGLTAAYLMRRIYAWKPGDTLLLYGAAGGVGLIVCQWAKLLGLEVIATVSTDEKAQVARAYGCDHVIVHSKEDIQARVMELTAGRGVPVVLDGVGAHTVQATLGSLARRGLWVAFGTSSGPLPPIDPMQLAQRGSIYFTRPALVDYTADQTERRLLADELFDHVITGRIRIAIGQQYALADAAHAHRELESGRTTGSSIFLP